MHLVSILMIALLAWAADAHLDHNYPEAAAQRREFLSQNKNNLNHCVEKHNATGLQLRAIRRRADLALKLLETPHFIERQLSSLNKTHKSSKHYNISTKPSEIFGGINSCVLSPEVTEGPFYVMGESVRRKIDDGQPGIPLYLDVQMIDINTCEPAKGVYLEIWKSNATGVYSGANAVPNGSGLGDLKNLNSSAMRGIQKSDDDGVVQFDTLFPGHYFARAIHIHFMAHLNATEFPNGTIWNDKAVHVGQGFFDDDLIQLTRTAAPYSTNMQPFTHNSDDGILRQEARTSDPFFEYILLGDKVQDGVLAWLRFGINSTFSRAVQVAAYKNEGGGQMNTKNAPGLGGWFPGGFPTSFYDSVGGGSFPTGVPSGLPPSLPTTTPIVLPTTTPRPPHAH